MPLVSPLLQYNISPTFSHQLTSITHLLCTYHFFPLLQYHISPTFSHQLTSITHLLHTYHFFPLLQYNISPTFSHQLTRITHLLHRPTYLFSPIITVQHLIHIQSSTYTHHSSVTYLPLFPPLLQYNVSSTSSHQLTCITHLVHTYHFSPPLLQYNVSSTFSHQLIRITHLVHSVITLHASLIYCVLTFIIYNRRILTPITTLVRFIFNNMQIIT